MLTNSSRFLANRNLNWSMSNMDCFYRISHEQDQFCTRYETFYPSDFKYEGKETAIRFRHTIYLERAEIIQKASIEEILTYALIANESA